MKFFVVFLLLLSLPFTRELTPRVQNKHDKTTLQSTEDESPPLILIDEGHNEIFGYKELTEALSFTEETLRTPIDVKKINGELNDSILSLTDMLILPAIQEGGSFSAGELRAVRSYVNEGGSLFVLGLPYSESVTPDLHSLNTFINFAGFNFSITNGKGDIVQNYMQTGSDDLIVNGTLLSLTKTLASDSALKFFNGVRRIRVRSSSLTITKEGNVSKIYAPPQSFSVSNSSIVKRGKLPLFSTGSVGEGYITALGFGRAFTNCSSPLKKPWINMADNKVFFANVLSWLLRQKGDEEKETVDPRYVFLSLGIVGIIGSVVSIFRRKRKEKRKEKPEKISEVLREIRKKREEKS